jgi:hypothetical protein
MIILECTANNTITVAANAPGAGLYIHLREGYGVHITRELRGTGEAFFWRDVQAGGTMIRLGPWLIAADGKAKGV